MAHELTLRVDGKTEMAWIGDTPWHGLGQQLQTGASIEEFQVAAGMDWSINRAPVQYSAGRGASRELCTMEGQTVLHRSDTRAALGVVSDDYQIVQPSEVLEFFRDISDQGAAQLHTAGTMFGGRRFWALAKIAEGAVARWDKIGGFLLMATSADGTVATTVMPTTVRVVCNNTLTMALGGNPARAVRVSHRQRFDSRAVKEVLKLAPEMFESTLEAANLLASRKVSDAEARDFVQLLLAGGQAAAAADQVAASEGDGTLASLLAAPYVPKLDTSDERKRAHPGEDVILSLFSGNGRGSNLPGSSGTAWGLVNAVTEYVDHGARAKSTDHRLDRAWFGTGAELKSDALTEALVRFG